MRCASKCAKYIICREQKKALLGYRLCAARPLGRFTGRARQIKDLTLHDGCASGHCVCERHTAYIHGTVLYIMLHPRVSMTTAKRAEQHSRKAEQVYCIFLVYFYCWLHAQLYVRGVDSLGISLLRSVCSAYTARFAYTRRSIKRSVGSRHYCCDRQQFFLGRLESEWKSKRQANKSGELVEGVEQRHKRRDGADGARGAG